MKVTSSKPDALKSIELHLKELAGLEGRVGWFDQEKYDDDTFVAYVASIQEFGAPSQSIPPRPFMRPTAIEQKQAWLTLAAKAAKQVIAGNITGEDAMRLLTKKAEDDVFEKIVSITSPALSPITIELRAMKRRDPSLKVTGKLVGEVAAKVRQPGYQPPSGVSTKPLNDTGKLIETLSSDVKKV